MYAEIVRGVLLASEGKLACTHIIFSKRNYTKFTIEMEKQLRFGVPTTLNWECNYCKSEVSYEKISCKNCGAPKIFSNVEQVKPKVMFMNAECLCKDIAENETHFLNYKLHNRDYKLDMIF